MLRVPSNFDEVGGQAGLLVGHADERRPRALGVALERVVGRVRRRREQQQHEHGQPRDSPPPHATRVPRRQDHAQSRAIGARSRLSPASSRGRGLCQDRAHHCPNQPLVRSFRYGPSRSSSRSPSSLAAPAAARRPPRPPTSPRFRSALRARGFYAGSVDGVAGPATSAAVRRLQRRRGLPADGVAGPRTRRALGRRGRPRLGSRPLTPERPRLGRRRRCSSCSPPTASPPGRSTAASARAPTPRCAASRRGRACRPTASPAPGTLAALRRSPPRSPLRFAAPGRRPGRRQLRPARHDVPCRPRPRRAARPAGARGRERLRRGRPPRHAAATASSSSSGTARG